MRLSWLSRTSKALHVAVPIGAALLHSASAFAHGNDARIATSHPQRGASAGEAGREPGRMTTPQLQSMVLAALQDATRRTRLDAASLKVERAEPVTWPDGSLGCPQQGMMYTQALVPGYRIRIVAGADTLTYHAGRNGVPFYCPASRATEPVADSRI
jgi:hypothetical protein